MTPIVFAPFLVLYLMAAAAMVWVAVIDVSTIEANPVQRPVGWCMAAYRERQGLVRPDPAPVEFPDWLIPDAWADHVIDWLCSVLAPEPAEPRRPDGALTLFEVVAFPTPPPARTLNRYAGAVA